MGSGRRHEVQDWPTTSSGWGICSCGASIRVEGGREVGAWHACELCETRLPHPGPALQPEVSRG